MALGAFDYATKQYDEIISQLKKSADRLNTGEFIEPLLAQQIPDKWGAFEPVDLSLPNHPDRIYLKDVMSQGEFQGELKTLRDLHAMRYQLTTSLEHLSAFKDVSETRAREYNKIKKDDRIKLTHRQLKGFEKRYKKLIKKVNKAFKNPDGRGLASASEKEQLQAFKGVTEKITNLKELTNFKSVHYKQRLRRVDGVLKWALSERYTKRKKQVSASLAALNNKLRDAKAQHKAAKLAYISAPKAFKGFNWKISKLEKKYAAELVSLGKVYQKQREKVGSIVKDDINDRQRRVMDYQLQARLAAARLFDETSNKERVVADTGAIQ